MIDVDFKLTLSERPPRRRRLAAALGYGGGGVAGEQGRRFDLSVQFASEAPTLAFFGPSGAGKSLSLQVIAGLLRPDAGHIRIGGRTAFDSRLGIDLPAARRETGFLFQNYALFPHLSVKANVAFGLTDWRRRRLSPSDERHVESLLESFGLSDLAASRPAHLSGGQQQRVALARALACRPSLLLLDEPFAALNPLLRDSLRSELTAMRIRWNVPMLMISHDVDDIVALADVVYVFDNGCIAREIDLRSGQSRALAARDLLPAAAEPVDSNRSRLRALLLDALPSQDRR
jgi:molybdate transport system ATP-binding protein